jgi:hypothetical protein
MNEHPIPRSSALAPAGAVEPSALHPQNFSPNAEPAPHDASIWPSVLAAGLTVAFFGLVTDSVSFGVLGILAFILGIGGWVGELRHAPEHE